jgi:hypothetical protein
MARSLPFSAVPLVAAVVVAGLTLTGCSTFYQKTEPAPALESTAGTALPPPDAGAAAAPAPSPYGESNTGGTYPYGAIPSEDAAAETERNVVVTDPEGNIVNEQAPDPAYQAAVDACYRFAQARIAHDVRMESDAAASLDQYSEGLGLSELRGRMRDYEQSGRRRELFERCMRERGYTPE